MSIIFENVLMCRTLFKSSVVNNLAFYINFKLYLKCLLGARFVSLIDTIMTMYNNRDQTT